MLLLICAATGDVFVRLRQRVLIAYIAAGITIGPAVFALVTAHHPIDPLAQVDMVVLLFAVCLKLNLQHVRHIGPVALATGHGQLAFTIVIVIVIVIVIAIGFLLTLALGTGWGEALDIAVALTFSTTTIIDDAVKISKSAQRWSPLLLAAILLVWELGVRLFKVHDFIFPGPVQITQKFGQFTGALVEAAWKTFWVTMVGFGLSIVVGVLLGFLIGSSRLVYTAVYRLMVAFNAVPKAAVVPILVVWFGIGLGPGIPTAFLISFFPITVNIATGLATLESKLDDVLRVLGARRWDVLIKVGLPRSMPYFYGSLKVSITLAFVGTVLAEMTAGDSGSGYLMQTAGSRQRLPLRFAGLVVIGVTAMIMYELFSWIEKRTTGWVHRGSQAI